MRQDSASLNRHASPNSSQPASEGHALSTGHSIGSLVATLKAQHESVVWQLGHLQEMNVKLSAALDSVPDVQSKDGVLAGSETLVEYSATPLMAHIAEDNPANGNGSTYPGHGLSGLSSTYSSRIDLTAAIGESPGYPSVPSGLGLDRGRSGQFRRLASRRSNNPVSDPGLVIASKPLGLPVSTPYTDSGKEGLDSAKLSQGSDNESCVSQIVYGVRPDQQDMARKLVARLQSRLDIRNGNSYVTPHRLRKTMKRLGSNRYAMEDLVPMLQAIADHARKYYDDVPRSTGSPGQAGNDVGLKFKHFARALVIDHESGKFNEDVLQIMLTCREILISGDANRLVAELTMVNVDELAQPVKIDHLTDYLEPVVGLAIILNGVIIGYEADQRGTGPEWFWIDLGFTAFFLLELMLKLYYRGFDWFVRGSDSWWNAFDSVLVLLGLTDAVLTAIMPDGGDTDTQNFSVIRVIRLTRLTRLFRVFRMKQMKELSLMLTGVVAGMRTLFWAIILLFFAVYILGIFATNLMRDKVPTVLDTDHFRTVPISMFTVFRCLLGDCQDEQGRPLIYLYGDKFGVMFVLSYIAATIFVVFGVFNLIFAIYIESTLAAAKFQRKVDRKESIRVARATRELLKKFALAQNLLEAQDEQARETFGDTKEFRTMMRRGSSTGIEINDESFQVTREVFAQVLKDPEVQTLMDSLDISPDRTHLFDILDADGSGDIEAVELIQGLLKVRGEAKKSDVVANLLAVRATQNMLRKVDKDIENLRTDMDKAFDSLKASSDEFKCLV